MTKVSTSRRSWLAMFLVLAVALLGAVASDTADAQVPIYGFEATTSSTQAGGHPDVTVRIEVATLATQDPLPCFCNAIRDLTVNTPSGLVGVPSNITQCTASELVAFPSTCPADSQVGIVAIRLYAPVESGGFYGIEPLYNMEPRPGQLALLGTLAPLVGTPIYTNVSARSESDYGLEFKTFGLPRIIPPNEITQFTWGVPGAHSHDEMRWATSGSGKGANCFNGNPLPALYRNEYPEEACESEAPFTPAVNPPTPFLLNPTSCEGPLVATLDTSGYENGREHAISQYPETTGCDQLAFSPSLIADPTTEEADSPSGLNVDLKVPQFLSPSASSPSEIRGATVTLPPGLTVDPNVADGKLACTDEEAGFGSREQGSCPEYSKIGTLTIDSSSLPAPLPGYVYLGKPLPGDRYRIFLIADGYSLHVKLTGTAHLDTQTGQVVVAFHNLPQTPFQEFDLHLFGAERGLLATPTQCGTYPVKTEFEPWDQALPNQESTQFFTIDSGPGGSPCPPATRPFSPKLSAGVTDNTGGHHSTFSFELKREDGSQNLSAVDISTPPGFSASLAGIPYCSDAALAAAASASASGVSEMGTPSCPAASQVGESSASAGAGSRPVSIPGKVYLAGPYKGAPLSLAVVTPAVVGPYDLGNVVIRVALEVDPEDAHVTALSDPLPQLVGGIPLRLRQVLVLLNRPEFVLNPTNCSPFQVTAQVFGEGSESDLNSPFQVANCGALSFAPKLDLRLHGGVNRLGHPAIHAVFRTKPGEANSHRVVVTLPPGELLDNSHVGNVCTKPRFAAGTCPESSMLGTAEVTTPILGQPLKGSVYLRSSSQGLPDLAIALKGQVDFDLVAHVDAVNSRLRTTFTSVPDVPVGTVTLDLLGGRKGLIQNSTPLCDTKKRATATMTGQNGATRTIRPPLRVSCGSGKGA